VKVADFGLARAERDPALSVRAGTPAYMAPEQLAGGAVDARSDQYAFAVTPAPLVRIDPGLLVRSDPRARLATAPTEDGQAKRERSSWTSRRQELEPHLPGTTCALVGSVFVPFGGQVLMAFDEGSRRSASTGVQRERAYVAPWSS